MRAKHFDIIVIGENLSGYIAAALLASRKYSVLHIKKLAGSNVSQGFGNPNRHTLPIFPGVFDYPVPTAVIRELNMGHQFRSIFKPSSPLFQVVGKKHRINIFEDRLKLVSELQREFQNTIIPDDIGNTIEHLEEVNTLINKLLAPNLPVHPSGLKEKWEHSQQLKEFFRHQENQRGRFDELKRLLTNTTLGKLFSSLEGYFSSSNTKELDLFSYRRAYGMFREILFQTSDEALKKIFAERFDKRGGRVLDELQLEDTKFGRGGFRFFDAKGQYSADSLICAFDFFMLPKLFKDKKTGAFCATWLKNVRPDEAMVKLSMMIEKSGLPEGMGSNLFIVPPKDEPDDDICFIHRDPHAPTEMDVERIDIYHTIKVEDFNQAGIDRVNGLIRNKVKWIIPFVDKHLKRIYPEVLTESQTAEHWALLAGRKLKYKLAGDNLFKGVPYNLPLKNAYLAGPEIMPELYLEGDFITGWSIAHQICKHKPKKADFR